MLETCILSGKIQVERSKTFKRLISVKKLMFWKRCNHFQKFGEVLLSLAIFLCDFGDSSLFLCFFSVFLRRRMMKELTEGRNRFCCLS